MSKGGSKKIEETSQQRAMAEFAMNQLRDYERRWLPVQKQLAQQIQMAGEKGSAARRAATGKASTDAALQFAQAEGALEKTLSNNRVNLGSSRAKLAITGMGADKAKSTALSGMIADQQIDDAYMSGLSALTAIGRGERAQVADSLGAQARQSSRQATADAEASMIQRAGNTRVAGQLAGYGLGAAMGPSVPAADTGFGSVPGGYTAPDGQQFNNPSAYTP